MTTANAAVPSASPPALLLSDAADRAHGEAIDAIARERGVALERVPASRAASRLDAVRAAWFSRDVFASTHRGHPDAVVRFFDAVDRAPALRWLHVMSAGADLPYYRASIARGVRMSTASGVTGVPIAHTVVAAVLAHARGFPAWLDAQRRREWAPAAGAALPRDLDGQTAVIVGLGPIGRETARLLRAVGLRTVGVRRRAEPMPDVDETIVQAGLDAVLPRCDWLVLCCPLTPETRGLVDASRLARLPAHARLVNVGRGALVDERALVSALSDGRLAGAYLDVFEREPLPADSPLWALPNVWLSPHNAAASLGNERRDAELFLDNLRRWLGGEPLRNETAGDAA